MSETFKKDDYSEISSINLGGKTFTLAENKSKSETASFAVWQEHSMMGIGIISGIAATNDYCEAVGNYNERIGNALQELKIEREQRGYVDVEITSEHCIKSDKPQDYSHQYIVIKSEAMYPEYRSADYLVQYATHGNGCRPDAIGRSVFTKDLFDSRTYQFDRTNVLGIADIAKLPKEIWTKIEQHKQSLREAEKPSVLTEIADCKANIKPPEKRDNTHKKEQTEL
jgi:hypothetical protein